MPIKEVTLGPNFSKASQSKKEKYHRMTRSLIFFIIETRPDIAFFIVIAACFAKNPKHTHIKVVKIIFCYFKGLIDCGIIYDINRKNLSIKSYSDFDWAKDKKS